MDWLSFSLLHTIAKVGKVEDNYMNTCWYRDFKEAEPTV
jgi:hypothetical protein